MSVSSYCETFRELAVFPIDAEEYRERHACSDQRAAAERKEREREPFGGQHAHVDAHVDDRLYAEPQAYALRNEGREVALEDRRTPADRKRPRHDPAEDEHDQRDAGEAELLRYDRKQEI